MPRHLGIRFGLPQTFPTPDHFWRLAQSSLSGSTALDYASSPVNGTINGTLYEDDSPVGVSTALRSDTSGYISLGSSCLPALDNPHSWSAWVRMSNLDALSTNGSTMQTLYSDYKDASNGIRIMMYRPTGRLKVSIFKSSGNVHVMTDALAWVDDNWEAHVGYTWSGSTLIVYVNGVAVASSSTTSESKPDGNYIMARSATLGQIHGSMANVRIWNSELSATAMQNVYIEDTSSPIVPATTLVTPGRLVFQDNFHGSVLNKGKWQPNWLAGNDTDITKPVNSYEDCNYDPANVTVSDGSLRLLCEARQTTSNEPVTRDYTSGLVNTYNRFWFSEGIMEARIYITKDSGETYPWNWPAIWSNGINASWPEDGEFDDYENLSAGAAVHYHGPPGSTQDGVSSSLLNVDGWHTVCSKRTATDWDVWYDNTHIFNYALPAALIGTPHYIIMNHGMEDNAAHSGPFGDGIDFLIDYMRVWELP